MPKFRKIPVVIEAEQFTGTNETEILFWMGTFCDKPGPKSGFIRDGQFIIKTLESNEFLVSPGDFVIRGIKGEFYACKPDVFALTYELAEAAIKSATPTQEKKNGD